MEGLRDGRTMLSGVFANSGIGAPTSPDHAVLGVWGRPGFNCRSSGFLD